MIKLHFEKVYSFDRTEPCSAGIPFAKGELTDVSRVCVEDKDGNKVPTQARATAYWNDGSVKWLFIRFTAFIPKNKAIDYYCNINSENVENDAEDIINIEVGENIIKSITYKNNTFDNFIEGVFLTDENDTEYDFSINKWEELENGSVCRIIRGEGVHTLEQKAVYKAYINITAYKNQDWFEIAYQIVNTTDEPLVIKKLVFKTKPTSDNVRSLTGYSNYKTKFNISENGERVTESVDANRLVFESNEHNAEVFYGAFFADYTDRENGYGVSASIYQAQQNYPKAVSADKNGMEIFIVPDNGNILMQSGMARQQKIMFHFHNSDDDIQNINNRATIYQMPDKPFIEPEIFEKSGVYEDVFTKNRVSEYEIFLEIKADEHNRCYGMMNWGDAPDMGYTTQGRGGGELVWTNNEYDFPHACALMYARTGTRRFLDYVLTAARHWIDVDICHYSKDPLLQDGQWEHTNGHCVNGKVVCSHQWVEGLLDYYHFTGDKEAYDTAIGIGKNVQRLLETPLFEKSGQANARETGWALRTLTALYNETNDEVWLEKCDWIVGHFEQWKNDYGLWLAPYMDNVAIRVVFMISVAVGSLMRYYRVKKNDKIKTMIIDAVDDLCENARLENGLFYYKELPSLKRLGNNPLILEALTIAYELTGDKKYLEVGKPTFEYLMMNKAPNIGGAKKINRDSVIGIGKGTKGFAQIMIPFSTYYTAAMRENIL